MLKTLLLAVFTLSLTLGCANKVDNSVACPRGGDKANCPNMKADGATKCDKADCPKKKTKCKAGCTKPNCAKIKADTP
jgi:hypothetical protein